nr:FAD binding domain-containing protein [Deltaproteobacteria bacterium]
MTEYLRPRTVDEALAQRAQHPDWMVLAGGTDLMVNANHQPAPIGIIDLWRLPGLGGISVTDAGVTIGAGST